MSCHSILGHITVVIFHAFQLDVTVHVVPQHDIEYHDRVAVWLEGILRDAGLVFLRTHLVLGMVSQMYFIQFLKRCFQNFFVP